MTTVDKLLLPLRLACGILSFFVLAAAFVVLAAIALMGLRPGMIPFLWGKFYRDL